jgi:hypothetical protein
MRDESPIRSAKNDLQIAIWTAVLLVVAFALRCYAITDDMYPDSVIYAQDAYNLLHGTFTLRDDSWYTHRLPVFAPVALAYAAWGVNWYSRCGLDSACSAAARGCSPVPSLPSCLWT